MEIYLKPIISACYIFPILAIIFTIPYILYEYNKYGSLLVIRTAIVYTFIFYMLTSYFMTILPLPPLDSVTPDSACMLLVPFDAVRRVIDNSGIIFSDPATYINIFGCPDFWQIIFNILLLLPFGVYLRYYFKRPWWQVLIFSFLYSLFFEFTQLSGLYGIYKYPYRFFEVDDLICNTLGGIAWCIDIFIVMLPVFIYVLYNNMDIAAFIYNSKYIVITGAYIAVMFTAAASISKGRTIGKALVNIRLVKVYDKKDEHEEKCYKRAGILRLAIRYSILYVISMPSAAYAYFIYQFMMNSDIFSGEWRFYACVAGIIICLFITFYMAFDLLLCLFSDTRNMLYDRIVKLTHISMSGCGHNYNTETIDKKVEDGLISGEEQKNQ